ncbi:MAG: hypothetical protein N2749_06985 [Clostridia bacterium]|nr:hypothetical protein [Clostridia bacterium]
MDYFGNKAIFIGVGVIITLTLTSGIMYTINQVKDIYKGIYGTDVSITKNFNEFDMYNGTQLTGLDLYNTAKKYSKDSTVTVMVTYYSTFQVDTTAAIGNMENSFANNGSIEPYKYEKLFKVSYVQNNGITTITFVAM